MHLTALWANVLVSVSRWETLGSERHSARSFRHWGITLNPLVWLKWNRSWLKSSVDDLNLFIALSLGYKWQLSHLSTTSGWRSVTTPDISSISDPEDSLTCVTTVKSLMFSASTLGRVITWPSLVKAIASSRRFCAPESGKYITKQ